MNSSRQIQDWAVLSLSELWDQGLQTPSPVGRIRYS
jgi:hypothetical protein